MEQFSTKKLDKNTLVMNHPFNIWRKRKAEAIKYNISNYKSWALTLFPIIGWIRHYNSRSFLGDLISGAAVGIMVIPQGLAYAQLAQLPPAYGLYTAFIGPIIYTLLGSSKDISLGPTAVLSMLTGQVISSFTDGKFTAPQIALALALLAGIINMILLISKLSILIEFISVAVVIGFTSGSAISIMTSQLPSLFGVKGVNTTNSAIRVFIDTMKRIGKTNMVDFGFGIASIVFILILKYTTSVLVKRNKKFVYLGVVKNALTIIVFTLISFGIFKAKPNFRLSIVKEVKSGLYAPKVPFMNAELVRRLIGRAITITIVVILEHIAIAKALARIDHYEIDNESELFSQAMANIIGAFFGSYASTGSFSRSSVNRASGSRTPMNGLWTTVVVGISLIALSKAFYYIPKPTITGIILTSVSDLVSNPKIVADLWRIDPIDFVACITAFIVNIVVSVEIGIYAAVGVSVFALLVRVCIPKVVHLSSDQNDDYEDVSVVPIEFMRSGIVVLKPEASFIFMNSSFLKKKISDLVNISTVSPKNVEVDKDKFTISTNSSYEVMRERYVSQLTMSRLEYNLDYQEHAEKYTAEFAEVPENERLPVFKGLVIDMSAVSTIDVTGAQALLDLEVELKDLRKQQLKYKLSLSSNPADTELIDETPNDFMIHYVNVKPGILRIMQVSGLTKPIITKLPIEPGYDFNSPCTSNSESVVDFKKDKLSIKERINIPDKMIFEIDRIPNANSAPGTTPRRGLYFENIHSTIQQAVDSVDNTFV
ncbi:hypothetical protein BB560_003731 [Smittium megazygosporum]|uniref:STAS domain-containing protein n=1 Tax=Smittium megazygosporum TaxID=133381 RepID=A0A2T9ZB97_9FUNG|nr:hypothetical protein BB560_003731 [Smittium megazygosporum]